MDGPPLHHPVTRAAPADAEIRIDVSFSIEGPPVPLDHAYRLYAALCDLRGNLHEAPWLAVHPLPGEPQQDGTLLLGEDAALRLRIPPAELPRVLTLAGQTMSLQGRLLRLGAPQLYVLGPAPALWARLVVIKGFTEPALFRGAVERQLGELGVRADVHVGKRRVVEISGRRVVGFSVGLDCLGGQDSLLVQYAGIGGRQRMGCGLFVPAESHRRPTWSILAP